jgi:hypothetical protein
MCRYVTTFSTLSALSVPLQPCSLFLLLVQSAAFVLLRPTQPQSSQPQPSLYSLPPYIHCLSTVILVPAAGCIFPPQVVEARDLNQQGLVAGRAASCHPSTITQVTLLTSSTFPAASVTDRDQPTSLNSPAEVS